jgi:predicted transcriptional regulator
MNNFPEMSIREMLQKIVEMKAPYSHDPLEMAMKGFKQHSEYAKEILDRIEKGVNIDTKEADL